MFGYQGGESDGTLARKRVCMSEARVRRSSPTHSDATTIHDRRPLATMAGDRLHLSRRCRGAWLGTGQDLLKRRAPGRRCGPKTATPPPASAARTPIPLKDMP